MQNFKQFIDVLDQTPPNMVLHTATTMLLKPYPWTQLLRAFIQDLSDEAFYATVDKMHIPHVDPRVFMIHEHPGRYQIVVHHFELDRFNKYMKENKIGAHHHHFSFATRIIKGGYSNVLYENSGTITAPILQPTQQCRCTEGSVYSIDYRQYHCVFRPEPDSMSLMIRSHAELDPGHQKEAGYTYEKIIAQKHLLLDLLRYNPAPQVGHLDEFEAYNPAKILGFELI